MSINISISTSFNYNIPLFDQLELIAAAGFNYVSLGEKLSHSQILDPSNRKKISESLAKYNLKIDTIHSPSLSKDETLSLIPDLIIAATQLSVPVIVVHVCPFDFVYNEYSARLFDILDKLKQIEKMLTASNIKMAIENVYPGIANQFIQEVISKSNPDFFGFCYDSAHDQIDGPRSYDLLENLKDRLLVMHLSDRSRPFVDHQIPGEGFIDFDQIAKIVKSTNYHAPLLLEVMMEHSKYQIPQVFLKQAFDKAKELYNKIYR